MTTKTTPNEGKIQEFYIKLQKQFVGDIKILSFTQKIQDFFHGSRFNVSGTAFVWTALKHDRLAYNWVMKLLIF